MTADTDPQNKSTQRSATLIFSGVLISLTLLFLPFFFPPIGKTGPDILIGLGRFHILALHMPIALLLLIPVAELLKPLKPAAYTLLALATLSAIGTSVLGLLLAANDGFSGQMVINHMWGGIVTTILCIVALTIKSIPSQQKAIRRLYGLTLLTAIISLIWGSHQGASLVHGEYYLTEKLSLERPPTPLNVEASAFDQLIKPVFARHCYACHSIDKAKGGFQMDDPARIFKGGDSGMPGIEPGSREDSEIHYRITLPPEKKAFMPPSGHMPLSNEQIELISWWIESGASFDASIDNLLKAHPLNLVSNLINRATQ